MPRQKRCQLSSEEKTNIFYIHKPPTCNDPSSLDFLDDCEGIERCIIIGESNSPGICWQFVNNTLSLGLSQLITAPTYNIGNTPDLLLTTCPDVVENLEISSNNLSGHNTIAFSLLCTKKSRKPT